MVFLHGGPGGGCDAKDRSFFDPTKYKVRRHPSLELSRGADAGIAGILHARVSSYPLQIVLFDQRGAGKSTPCVLALPFRASRDGSRYFRLTKT